MTASLAWTRRVFAFRSSCLRRRARHPRLETGSSAALGCEVLTRAREKLAKVQRRKKRGVLETDSSALNRSRSAEATPSRLDRDHPCLSRCVRRSRRSASPTLESRGLPSLRILRQCSQASPSILRHVQRCRSRELVRSFSPGGACRSTAASLVRGREAESSEETTSVPERSSLRPSNQLQSSFFRSDASSRTEAMDGEVARGL